MAGELTDYGERVALDCLLNNETGPADLYIGLATSSITDTDDLSSIDEEDDSNYERQSIDFNSAETDGGTTIVENSNQIEFGPWDGDADSEITYAFLTEDETGDTGDIIGTFQLTNAKQPASGEKVVATEGEIIFESD